jgi:hypothetical protein
MGYGAGAFLLAVGLILALAVQDNVDAVDLTTVGWILTAVGAGIIVLTAVTWNSGRRSRATQTVTHADGSQTVREQRSDTF